MHSRIGSVLAALALTVALTGVAVAQADDATPLVEGAVPTDPSPVQQPTDAPTLFLTIVNPAEPDVEVPLDTPQLAIHGTTLPGAVVSIDGDLVDIDDQGTFDATVMLDEGANEIEVVASDDQGNQLNTSLFITRGE